LKFNTEESYDKLSWSRETPDLIAGYNFETQRTSVLSFTPEAPMKVAAEEPAQPEPAVPEVSQTSGAPYAPKWLHPKSGVRFGFGGVMVSFSGKCIKVTKAVSHDTESFISEKVT
jgi:hypothetical protein